ncbi:MAG TPA: hypothetical protein VHO95_12855, partial [Candidatus Dormibacteraeota bacterium]|nr:hypothetical protein [Candidatus Dormibacteraeota bacterium]
ATSLPPDALPQTPVWVGDRLYLSNAFANGPTNGEQAITLWLYSAGIAKPVAAIGDAATWDLLKTEPYRKLWPAGIDINSTKSGRATFAWSDLDGDGRPQPNEVRIVATDVPGFFTLDQELGVTTSTARRYVPASITAGGAPIYDLTRSTTLAAGGRAPDTSGGGQVIAARDGWTVFTWPPAPLSGAYVAGTKNGKLDWTYPVDFIGLGMSQLSKPPHREGEVIGTTRLLGSTVKTSRGIELWAINGNYGQVFLFTTDGLLLATLFQDSRVAPPWPEVEQRGANLDTVSLGQECFYPSIQQMSDGRVYLIAGQPFAAIFEITGLDSIQRLSVQPLTVTTADAAAAQQFRQIRSPEAPPPTGYDKTQPSASAKK